MRGSVLVIGSGIAGMRAAAELAQQGIAVHLLEQRPTIGGTMAQLDKMYPSNECATCTQLPKMLELTSNPNVGIIAFAELEQVRDLDGGFAVRIRKKARYVDPLKCNACTECFPVCPVGGVPMDFNLGRGKSKAIRFWSPFPPRIAIIDPEACTYLEDGKCGDGTEPLCVEACQPDAIDFSQQDAEIELEVGAILLATGAVEHVGEVAARLGHRRLAHVLTSLEFERLLSGLGPTGGVIKRDDGSSPKRVAWVVCEDFETGELLGSPVAFMTAVSEALGTLERGDIEATVISKTERTDGKGYAAFRAEAEQRGVRFVHASAVDTRQADSGGVLVSCGHDGGASTELEADMLVLACPLAPHPGAGATADKLVIELDARGLPKRPDGHPLRTTRAGIFACGSATEPLGIREAVIQACGAAAHASARLADARGTEVKPRPEPELRSVAVGDEPRIAVVICRCGANIAGVLDIQALADYVADLPSVARVEVTPFGCDGVKVKELLGSGEYNRIVLGACSPRTHEPLFQMHTEAGGLNRHLLEIVNLRNHCTWVHTAGERDALAEKARTLMRMGIARAALLEPLDSIRIPITQACLVVGGTPAGLASAAMLTEMGFVAHLVIAEEKPGAGLDAAQRALLARALETIEANGRIHVYPGGTLGELSGYVGRYSAEIHTAGQSARVDVGAVIIATRDAMGQKDAERDFEKALYLSRDDDAHFVGALGNLNPLDFNTDGIFLCGSAREDADAAQSMVSGEAAASRVATLISHDELEKSPIVSKIVDANCDGCAYCIDPCPAHAIILLEYMRKGDLKKTVQVNEALCKGCGSCMATCPKQGAYVAHFRPEQLTAMVNVVLEVA
ncbi:MAG: FAD-dependent oxidoreductase [Deltaproteobacteria bacterium]|nr:FAD-dependent oxidoreductase [Deltaproteobacteria bacterium]